jgi:hypothetical protein
MVQQARASRDPNVVAVGVSERAVELRPMPDHVVARVQQTKDYRYAVADNRVLLVR